MKNKKNLIIVSMMVIVAVMAIGYSYFATRLNINATGNITSEWNVYFSNIAVGTVVGNASNAVTPSVSGTTANMEANLALPGDSITYELTLTNGGTIGAIIEDIEAKAEGSSAIIYSISGLKIGDKLAGGESKVISIKIEYDPNATSQPSETSKTLTVSIDAVQDIGQSITSGDPVIEGELGSFVRTILKNNKAYADNVASTYVTSETGIDFSKISSDTNGRGLYYTSTNTEDNKQTYYFRGEVENNYVSFGTYKEEYYYNGVDVAAGEPIIWRIVRINEDGSIRLIKEEGIADVEFNKNINDNAYVGYMYGTLGASTYELVHTNTTNSTIKETLDTWYTKHLSSYSNLFAQDAGFCNDRSISSGLGYGTSLTFYGSYDRHSYNHTPQFACPNESNDLFTSTSSNKGNKKLVNPVGLLTIDEVVYSGGVIGSNNANQTYYLNNGTAWWTMTPDAYEDGGVYIRNVETGGFLLGTIGNRTYGARPVVNLASNIEIEDNGAEGTIDSPYVIKTN